MVKLGPLLRLIRLPNLFTAPVDSLAGWYLSGAAILAFNSSPRAAISSALLIAATSVLCYLGGIVLNDLVDLKVDRLERPTRPLPSNAISPRAAAGLSLLAFLVALALSPQIGGKPSLIVTALLILMIVLYNVSLKGMLPGIFAMGLCRGLNVLLGASAAFLLGGAPVWMLAVAITVYVAGITSISRSETNQDNRGDVWVGLFLLASAFVLLGFVPVWDRLWRGGPEMTPSPWTPATYIGLLGVGLILMRAVARALRTNEPTDKQAAVKAGVLSLPWTHASIVLGAGGWWLAPVLIALGLTARLVARRLYVT